MLANACRDDQKSVAIKRFGVNPLAMSDVLFIKTSSLGDVIHQMPAMTELRRISPATRISWVVENAYAPLVRLNAAVDAVIAVDSRRWRHALHRAATWREARVFLSGLRARAYDEIIDTQGSFAPPSSRSSRVAAVTAMTRRASASRLRHSFTTFAMASIGACTRSRAIGC